MEDRCSILFLLFLFQRPWYCSHGLSTLLLSLARLQRKTAEGFCSSSCILPFSGSIRLHPRRLFLLCYQAPHIIQSHKKVSGDFPSSWLIRNLAANARGGLAPQQGRRPVRNLYARRSPCSLQLEKASAKKWRSRATKNKQGKKKGKR